MTRFAAFILCWAAACAPQPAGTAGPPPGQALSSLAEAALDEAAVGEPGPAAAAALVETYFAAIAAGDFETAWPLVADQARPAGATRADFAAAFADYAEYRAEVGAPGPIEGAAGSLWIEVPVRVRGRMESGEAFDMSGVVVLSRCNAVPGCTPGQRRWRIVAENIGLGR